jgi:adenine specific DNA methylase Mod
MLRAVRNHSGDVYDPFLGSGTTLIAAQQESRACFGLEIEPQYCDVTVQRWQNYTGEHATLADDGRPFNVVADERGVAQAAAAGSPADLLPV